MTALAPHAFTQAMQSMSDAYVMAAGFLCEVQQRNFNVWVSESARMMPLPRSIKDAIDEARRQERAGLVQPPMNSAETFAIAAVEIAGNTRAVTTDFIHLSPTSDMWHFRAHKDKNRATIVLFAPISGSHPLVMRNLAIELLSHHNVVVVGAPDPRYLPNHALAGVPEQIDNSINSLVHLSRLGAGNFVVVGTSQSGVVAAAVTALMAAHPETYGAAVPAALVLNGAPMDVEKGETALNWMARTYDIDDRLFIHLDHNPDRRRILPYGVMQALFKMTSDTLKYDLRKQDIDADHVQQMHQWIFRENRLARGNFTHRGERVNLSAYQGILATIAGAADGIVPAAQTHAAHHMFENISAANREAYTLTKAGHYDTVQQGDILVAAAARITAIAQCVALKNML